MAGRMTRLTHEFVEYVPEELDDGVVYVSVRWRVAVHSCCCGCGERVVTPLDPAQWTLLFDGQNISLKPSIAGGRCNSHYVITTGKVRWEKPLSRQQRTIADGRDQAALEARYGQDDHRSSGFDTRDTRKGSRWAGLWRRLFR
jgi:hypothetical protein